VLVPPGDLPALCRALLELAASPELRVSLGQKGRAFVCKHWSAEHVLPDFESRLRELVPPYPKFARRDKESVR
jgi:hypothetical protein